LQRKGKKDGTIEKWDEVVAIKVEVGKKENWQFKEVMRNKLTCAYLHDQTYDKIRVITEINVSQDIQTGQINIEIIHHGNVIEMTSQVQNLITTLQTTPNKVIFLMSYITSSNICCGFSVDDNVTDYNGNVVCIFIQKGSLQGKRAFSKKCDVFTNFNGQIKCSMCQYAKDVYQQYTKRNKGQPDINPRCNHRYMSRKC